MNKYTVVKLLAFTLPLLLASVDTQAQRARAAGAKPNAQGGVTAGAAAAGTTPAGTRHARGAVVASDGQGNAAGAFQRGGGVAASGANGSVNSQGSVSGDGQGNVGGSRATNASSSDGSTYSGETDYNTSDGVTHSGSCTNASGAVVACPKPKG